MMSELPLFQCHKKVRAVHIAGVEIHKDGSATIAPREQNIEPFKTDAGWGERFKGSEEDPGVYVVYDDGYASWSPTDKFDAGYAGIDEHLSDMVCGELMSMNAIGFGKPDAVYMLESAINATAAAATDSDERSALVLDEHLKELCALQLSHIERLADYDYAIATGLKDESAE